MSQLCLFNPVNWVKPPVIGAHLRHWGEEATECFRGHQLTPGNIYWARKPHGRRVRKCRACLNLRKHKYRQKTREQQSAYHAGWRREHKEHLREYDIQRTFGISRAQYLAIKKSASACALCGAPLSLLERRLDHDHNDGRLRGILCSPCNLALGSYEKLRRAAGIDRIEHYLQHAQIEIPD